MSLLHPRQNAEAELAAFEQTCQRLGGFDDQIVFEWVDGFLAALAAGPRLPATAEWLEALFHDTFERAFADPEDHAQALRSLETRLQVLCDQLDPEALFEQPEVLRLEPLFAELVDADRQRMIDEFGLSPADAAMLQTGVLWAEGVLDGIEAFDALWAWPGDEEADELFSEAVDQIAALALPPDSEDWQAHLTKHYPKGPPTRDEMLAEACWSVQDLRMYWVDFAPKPEQRRVAPAPGRNDPCPCGSGKKFKKCHGA